MLEYVRPEIPARSFRDDAGAVIRYGERWNAVEVPEDSYSVVIHPERFAPLPTVAEALVGHLIERYEVRATEDPRVASDLLHRRDDADMVRAIRLTPSDPLAAPLTFALTGLPGVIVHAGVLYDAPYPVCGCDACDEAWEPLADELEHLVFAVVDGRFQEEVTVTRDVVRIEYEITTAEGPWQSGSRDGEHVPPARLRQARHALARLPDTRWRPWPRRSP